MASGTRQQQSQRVIEEQLGSILQTLKQQEAGAIERHEQLQAEVVMLTSNLQEQRYKLEAQKVCYEELRQQMEGLTASHSEQQQNMDRQLEGVKQQVKSLFGMPMP